MCNRSTHHASTRGKISQVEKKGEQFHYMCWGLIFPVKLPVMSFYHHYKCIITNLTKRADEKGPNSIIGPKQSYVTSHYHPDTMDFSNN